MAPRFDDLSDLHCGEKSDNKYHLGPMSEVNQIKFIQIFALSNSQ